MMKPPLNSWFRSDKVVLTSYGRTALYLALRAIDVRNKEVMIPAFTCATTLPPAILQSGGVPVFVDISKDTIDMDLNRVEKKISPRVRVVISHHYYGAAASNLEEVQQFASRHRLVHIEDCTHSLGAGSPAHEVGRTGDVAVFSFSKLLNCPGGGAVSFKDPSLFKRASQIQRASANPFHQIVTDTDALRYESELVQDRPGSLRIHAGAGQNGASLFLRRLLKKAVCDSKLYRSGNFRAMSPADVGMFRPRLDTRMTRLQYSRIRPMMECLGAVISARRRKARMFMEVVPPFFRNLGENVLMNYVAWHSNPEHLAQYLSSLGIRTRRVWPYFQKYWPAQMTDHVRELRDHLLLVDIDCINEEVMGLLRGRQTTSAAGQAVHAPRCPALETGEAAVAPPAGERQSVSVY